MKLLTVLLLYFLCGYMPICMAKKGGVQPPVTSEAQLVSPAEMRETMIKALEEDYKKRLSEERAILERQNDRQFSSLEKLIDKAIWVFGVLFVFAAGAFAFLFGKSWLELKSSLKQVFEAQANQIIEKQAEQLRERYQRLQREVDSLRSYKDRNVAWVLPNGVEPTPSVLAALNATGLRSPALLLPRENLDFQIGDPDLVIFTYDGSEDAKAILKTMCDQLKQKSPPVPLLIYSFDPAGAPVRLEEDEFNAMRGFDWFIPVNFPAQLLAQTQLLIRQDRRALGDVHG